MHSVQKSSLRLAHLSLALSMLLTSIAVSIPNVALPLIARDFGSSVSEAQRVIVAYLFAVTFTIVVAGRLGDTLGRRKVLLIGILLYAVSALYCVFAPTLWLLVVARGLQGLGGSIVMSLTVASTAEISSTQRVGSSIGLLATMSAVGTAAGPSLGGIIVGATSWQCTFMLMALLGMLSFYLVYRYLPAPKRNKASPPLQLTILRRGGLSSNLVMNAIVSTVMMSTLIVGPFYLTDTLGLAPTTIGFIMSVGPLMSIISGIPSGRVVDRLGTKKVISIGLAVMGLGASALVILPPLIGMVGFIVATAILSPGYQLFQAANSTSAMTAADVDQRGMVSGLLSFSRNLGLMAGASLMGSIYAHSSMQITFLTAIVLTGIALGVAQKGKYEAKLT